LAAISATSCFAFATAKKSGGVIQYGVDRVRGVPITCQFEQRQRRRASSFDGAAAIPHSQRLHSALGISPPNRQSAKPLNPVSTKSQEGHFRILGVRGLNLSICAKLLPTQGLPPILPQLAY
jgi:hypothetical protein